MRLVGELLGAALLFACGGGAGRGEALADGVGSVSVMAPQPGPDASSAAESSPAAGGSAPACESPDEGCPCSTAGAVVRCRGPAMTSGSYVYCDLGFRVCQDGTWGACVLPRVF